MPILDPKMLDKAANMSDDKEKKITPQKNAKFMGFCRDFLKSNMIKQKKRKKVKSDVSLKVYTFNFFIFQFETRIKAVQLTKPTS